MSEIEREEIMERIKAMSNEEKKLVAQSLPVEICFNRVGMELEMLKNLSRKTMEIFTLFPIQEGNA